MTVRWVSIWWMSISWMDEGQELVSTELYCGPRVGAHGEATSSKPPSTHSQHMLDYLWQRNLRQFIYKVGSPGPGRPTRSSSPSEPTLTPLDLLSSRASSIAQHRWATRWLTTCTYCSPLHWGCWSSACGHRWTPTARWVPLGYRGWGQLELGLESVIVTTPK